MTEADVIEMHRRMLLIRRFEERVADLYRDGEVPGFVHLSIGQEATAVGECFASVPGAPGGIGFALAAHWQGALIWWAFDAQRPLDNYLNESLRTLISLLLRSPSADPRRLQRRHPDPGLR